MAKLKLDGLRISIVDDIIVEQLGFIGKNVVATIGSKEGAVCAPILEYKITGEGSLVIDPGNFNIVWSKVEIGENEISTLRNGVPTKYTIVSKPEDSKNARKLP